MNNKISKLIIFLIIICIGFKINSIVTASEKILDISLNANNKDIVNNEKLEITVSANNYEIAACTLWIYYENEKVECITNNDNINILENKIIYTWYSTNGKNETLSNILNLEFIAKSEGIATFSAIGELYNENGEKIDFNGDSIDINIGNTTKNLKDNSNQDLIAEVQKDDNSLNLGILRTNHEGISPDFNEDILEYYLIVDETVDSLDITAIPESKRAEVIITGNKKLKIGLNIIKITVSINGDSKIYTINVTKTSNEANANANLQTLDVEYYTLDPEYDSNITNYYVEVSNTESSINVLAIPEDEMAKVRISGNANLKYGKNNIIVTVTAKNGITVKKYNIEVYRRNKEEEKKYQEEVKKKVEEANDLLKEKKIEVTSTESIVDKTQQDFINSNNNKILIIVILTIAIIVVGIVIIIFRKRKNNTTK